MSRLNLILALKGKKAIDPIDDNDSIAGKEDIKSPPLLVTTPLTPTSSDAAKIAALETLNTEKFQSPTSPTLIPSTFQSPSESNQLDNKTLEAEPPQEPLVDISEPNVILESAQDSSGIPPSNQEVLPTVNQVIQPDQEIVPTNDAVQPNPDPDPDVITNNVEVAPPAVMNTVRSENPELIQTQ